MILDSGWVLLIMAALFLGLGYLGVPVPFAIMAGVFTATMLTPISMQSMVGQLFNGLDAEALLAVPFFLLVGELMTSADVTRRVIVLAQVFVGHMRGGLGQVVTLFSMFFAGISGSSTADVAVLSRTVAPEMDREGYGRGFTAALLIFLQSRINFLGRKRQVIQPHADGVFDRIGDSGRCWNVRNFSDRLALIRSWAGGVFD